MQINLDSRLAKVATALMLSASLAACGGGGGGTSTATSAGSVSESPPAQSPAPPAVTPPATAPTPDPTPEPTHTNRAPSISGSAITSVTVGQGYSFQPTATDADGDALQFSIASKPSWATFDASTGRLMGSPTNSEAGSYEEIEISVTDGQATAKLPQFAIVVMPGMGDSHTITISWSPPTQNTDGSALTNLNGYRIAYGTTSGQYTKSVEVKTAGVTSYVLENLPTATYYFAIHSRASDGSESDPSNEASIRLN